MVHGSSLLAWSSSLPSYSPGLKGWAFSFPAHIVCPFLEFYSWDRAPPLCLVHIPSPLQHCAHWTELRSLLCSHTNYTSALIVQDPFFPNHIFYQDAPGH